MRIHRLAEALGRRGHEVHVVTYHLGADTPVSDVEVHRTPALRSYTRVEPGPSYQKLLILDPMLRRTLNRVLRQQRFDVVHAHHYEGLLVARSIAPRHRPPVIYDAHTLLGSELPFYSLGLGPRLLRRAGAFLDRRLPGSADHVVTVSETLRDRLLGMGTVPAARISVVANGVEARLFDVEPTAYPDGFRRIVFAGNLAEYQGVDHLLAAFAYAHRRRPDIRLQLLTESSVEPYVTRIAALGIRDAVEVLPVPFAQLPPYLRAAAAAINPRVGCDGVPQKLMNYMAAGCPIVSFRGSGVHLRHRENGWLVDDGDTDAMGEGILALLADPGEARRMGDAARQQIVRQHSWDRTAQVAEGVYADVLDRRIARTDAGHAASRREASASMRSLGWLARRLGTRPPAR